ncbi:hypothetical protein Trydic_g8589 [Trypoxylus dichotomus]
MSHSQVRRPSHRQPNGTPVVRKRALQSGLRFEWGAKRRQCMCTYRTRRRSSCERESIRSLRGGECRAAARRRHRRKARLRSTRSTPVKYRSWSCEQDEERRTKRKRDKILERWRKSILFFRARGAFVPDVFRGESWPSLGMSQLQQVPPKNHHH